MLKGSERGREIKNLKNRYHYIKQNDIILKKNSMYLILIHMNV